MNGTSDGQLIEVNGISLYVEDHGGGVPVLLPPVTIPTLGIWSSGDHYLDGERFRNSAALVQGPWRYEEIPDVSHWVPLDAPDRLNELLSDWLR
jgi:pimeloyl-ACP methyl ester carboxylesterase